MDGDGEECGEDMAVEGDETARRGLGGLVRRNGGGGGSSGMDTWREVWGSGCSVVGVSV